MPITAHPPIRLPEDRSRYGAPGFVDRAFNLPDAQGMYSLSGPRIHGGVDWFGAEDKSTPVYAPQAGVVIQAYRTGDRSGQVFGGVVKIETADGKVWVMRHVDPRVTLGQRVKAGQQVATVTRWIDAGDHLHLELWKRRTAPGRSSGYWIDNALDPALVQYDLAYGATERPDLYFHLILNGREWRASRKLDGYAQAGNAIRWIVKNGLRDDADVVLAWRGPNRVGRKPYVFRGPDKVEAVIRSIHRTHGRAFS